MIDLPLQGLFGTIQKTVRPYAEMKFYYDPELDVVEFLKRNPEAQTQKATDPTKAEVSTDSFLFCLYKRSAFKFKPLGRHRTLTILSPDPTNQLKYLEGTATHGYVTVDFRVLSQSRELLEMFESLFNTRIQHRASLSISVKLQENSESFGLYYNLSTDGLEDLAPVNSTDFGSLWSLDFSIQLLGYYISPDGTLYPKIKTAYIQSFFGSAEAPGSEKTPWIVYKKDVPTGIVTRTHQL